MSNVEHYFENLLFHGHDIKGEPNKNALSKEVQDAVEQCAIYIKYTYNDVERNNNSDMVSRDDVISICNILGDKMDDEGRVAVEQVRDAVKDMRPCEERKTGKWIHTGIVGNPVRMGRCSECLEIVSWDSETGVSFEDYKFCPYCGVRMEVDE